MSAISPELADEPGAIVEKTMSLSANEFWSSIAVLRPRAEHASRVLPVVIQVEGGFVEIGFDPLAPARLGGLLELPRARVTIDMRGVESAARRPFLSRFDVVFQRGGG